MLIKRLVREMVMNQCGEGFRFQVGSLCALQEVAELFLVGLFEDTNLCSIYAQGLSDGDEHQGNFISN